MTRADESPAPLVVMTIGHSTHPIAEFIYLLRSHGVARLVDVRTVPRSRHNPQFNREELAKSLADAQIHYSYMPGLGGFRRARKQTANPESADVSSSRNAGWRNAGFRGYADYMQTAEFERNLEQLIALAATCPSTPTAGALGTPTEKVAIMCAEAVPWRCHRSLIADALTVRGIEAREITGASSERLHKLTPFARVQGTRISYPPQDATA